VNVTSNGRSLKDVLTGGFYKIPRFQRSYSWDRSNVDDFWTDITESSGTYFIGSMVVYTKADGYGLVDGQQRLTTVTLLLAALRNAFIGLNSQKEANGLQTLIERVDTTGSGRFVLEAETSYPFLQAHVQSMPGDADEEIAASPEEVAIEAAYKVLTTRVQDVVASFASNPALTGAALKKAQLKAMTQLRDKVLGLAVVLVEVDSEDDATIIFQTLNSRGKDLEVADLVKSHLFSILKVKGTLDQPRDKWNAILESFEESSADLDINRFLLHSWLSRQDYVGERTLFKAIKAKVKKNNAKDFLTELTSDARLYRIAQEPSYGTWAKAQAALPASLRAMMLFRLRQPLPMVLAVLRAYENKDITLAQAKAALHALEGYHFVATAVTNQPSSGGVSKMYAASARSLLSGTSQQDRGKVITDLATKLRTRRPSYAEFEASFVELKSSKVYSQQAPLVRYTLAKLHQHLLPKATSLPVDLPQLTIEHLAPQGSKKPSGTTDADVAKVGNLILVTQNLNGLLSDDAFTAKRAALAKLPKGHVEAEILAAAQWTTTEIEDRSKRLAKLAYDKVWSF
jgi:hypothetical protein